MFKILLMLLIVCSWVNIAALGQTGHRITGQIAEQYLTENTRISLQKILGNVSLAEASNYPDVMRSSSDYFWKKVSRPYHYITVPKGKTYDQVGAPKQGDAMFALAKFSQIVRDPSASIEDKVLAIKFIIHLIGDLHQPLHVGTGLDRGGNDFKVKLFGQQSNLHRVWDSGMINHQQLSYTEWSAWLGQQISEDDLLNWSNIDPHIWINESIQIRNSIYPDKRSLSYGYVFQYLPTLKQRLKQAGVRIAAYLNDLMAANKSKR